jgi:hypothetical protein
LPAAPRDNEARFRMMSRRRRRTIVLTVVVAAALYATAATVIERHAVAAQAPARPPSEAVHRVDVARLMADVTTLSAPSFEGRRTGSAGGRKARQYIRNAYAAIGLAPAEPDGYDQPFRFTHRSIRGFVLPGQAWTTDYADAANLLGRVRGTDSTARTIVVSAHYDHLGVQNGRVYPGADDNASGVAALLEVARYVQRHPLRHQALFAAFDAEELGLQGARAFVKRPPIPLSSIAIDVNLDMVSRSDRDEIFAAGTYQTPSLRPMLEEVQRRSAVRVLFGHDRPSSKAGLVDDWTDESDHGVFNEAGIPFIYFGVEDHPDYHQPTDTADRINPTFFGNVADMVLDAVLTFDRGLQ